MNRKKQPLALLVTRLARRHRLVLFWWNLLRAAILTFGLTPVFLILSLFVALPVSVGAILGMLALMSFFYALFSALFSRPETVRLLLAADRRYKLHETLITAWELTRSGKHNPFAPVVLKEAEQAATRVQARTVFPARIPAPRLLAAAVALAVAALIGYNIFTATRAPAQGGIVNLGRNLSELGNRLAVQAEQHDDVSTMELARELERFGRQLTQDPANLASERERVKNLIPRLESQIKRIERGEAAGDRGTDKSKNAEEELADYLKNRLSDSSARRTVRRMSEQNRSTGEILQQLQEGDPTGEERPQTGDIAPDRKREILDGEMKRAEDSSELADNLERARDQLKKLRDGSGSDSPGDGSSPPEDGTPSKEQSPRIAEGDLGGGAQGDSKSPSEKTPDESQPQTSGIGSEPAPDGGDTREDPRQPEKSRLQELPKSQTTGDVIHLFVRELPDEATAALTPDEVAQRFERVRESAIHSDAIPPERRELVRNYFLAIGTGSESGTE